MPEFTIDWDNLPVCGDPEIVISSAYCVVGDDYVPPGDPVPPPVHAVPVPATLGLFLVGIAAMKWIRRRK